MSEELDFRRATRRLLFPEQSEATRDIPGAGRSAADEPQRHTRVKVTINLDGDMVQYFKEWAKREGRPYQSLINQVLREFVLGTRPEHLAQQVHELLLQDEKFLEELRLRMQDEISGTTEE